MSDLTAVVDGAAPPETASTPPPAPDGSAALPSLGGYDGPASFDEMRAWAAEIAASEGMVPDLYTGRPANVIVAMLEAQRLNIPVMAAIHELWYDGTGQVAMKASLIQRLVRRARHDLIIHRADAERAVIEIVRGDGKTGGTVEWSIGEATVAGLVANQTWQDYPADSLFARCVARLARRYAADATGGIVYEVDELATGYADGGDADAPLIDRTVTPIVTDLLTGLDTASHAEVRRRWQSAADGRLLNAYAADSPDGMAWTVGMVLRRALEQTMPAPRGAPPISGAPAGAGGLAPCGQCTVEHVITYGDHQPACPAYIGDPLGDLTTPTRPAPVMVTPAPVPSRRPATKKAKAKKKTRKGKGGRRGGRR